jgi:SAM-dependent methyltransferase
LTKSAGYYVERLVEVAALTPSSKVLDIDSGFGRLAVGLIPYLDQNGSYDGLDIVPAGIDWCKFPFDAETFDLVTLTSVFTHMLPAEVDNYLAEIARVLKPNGRCYATYLLLTAESRPLMSSKDSIMDFKYNCGSYWLVSLIPDRKFENSGTFLRHQRTGRRFARSWHKPRFYRSRRKIPVRRYQRER